MSDYYKQLYAATIPAQAFERLAATRLGDLCTGHGCWPPRPNDEAKVKTVLINNIPPHCEGEHWEIHCCVDCHDGYLQKGSSTVVMEKTYYPSRVGDPVTCGSYVMTGSPNVRIGG